MMRGDTALDREAAFQEYRRASGHFRRGEYEEALEILERLQDVFPKHATLAVALDMCLEAMARRDAEQSVADLKLDTPAPFMPEESIPQESKPKGRLALVCVLGALCGIAVGALWTQVLNGEADAVDFRAVAAGPDVIPHLPDDRIQLEENAPESFDVMPGWFVNGVTGEHELPETVEDGTVNGDWEFEAVWSKGGLTKWSCGYGDFMAYVPNDLARRPYLIFAIHGAPPEGVSREEAARALMGHDGLRRFADLTGHLLVAPVFDEERYPAYHVSARPDIFVLGLWEAFAKRYDLADRRFVLYGYDGGGQFVQRFAVRHPERVLRGVVAGAGAFIWPDDETEWPNGFANGPAGSRAALGLPLVAVAGDADTAANGDGRAQQAEQWVRAWNRAAMVQGIEGNATFVLLPDAGHSVVDTLAACLEYLLP